ncbi:hypothetical protein [Rubrivirga sp.]|uniref:hypothetical protein n=1 Tax=Rubrivirga sp. TaxID=1885344 RepID=UPI003B52F8CD
MRWLLVALVLLSAADAHAQFRRAEPFAEKGDVALVAELAGLSDLRLLPTLGGIGVRYRLADQTVFGTSVSVQVIDFESESDGEDQRGERNEDREDSDFAVALWLEQHLGPRRRAVSPFVGAGLQIGAGSSESTSERSYFPCRPSDECELQTQRFDTSRESMSVGGALFVGAEVRLVRGVTLGGAYTLGVRYTDAEFRTEGDDGRGNSLDETRDDSALTVSTSASRLSLSVYF